MDIPGPVELLIIAGVVMVLFGSKKLPDAARSFGRSLRIFKAETKGLHDDESVAPAATPVAAIPAAAADPETSPVTPVAERPENA